MDTNARPFAAKRTTPPRSAAQQRSVMPKMPPLGHIITATTERLWCIMLGNPQLVGSGVLALFLVTILSSRLYPRLLTASQAAEYLGYNSIEVLRKIPVLPIKLTDVGVGAGPRYDRKALDQYLDHVSGIASGPPTQDEAEAALEAWRLSRATAA